LESVHLSTRKQAGAAEYASSLEKGSKDQVVKEAKQIVDTDLERRLRIPQS
jgi:hypothetical protein